MNIRVRKQIRSLSFSLIGPEVIKKISAAKIVTPELYDVDGYPVDGGVMDLRLGAIDPGVRCRTCGGGLKECLGHPGSIELARPVVHIKYIPLIELLLKSFCKNCSRILLSDEEVRKLPLKRRIKKSKDAKKCPHCGAAQEKIKIEKPTTFYIGKRRIFPNEMRDILVKMSNEDLRLMGINGKTCRPEWSIITLLLVPPVTVRPSITLETGERSEDDLTHKLTDIIRANQRLWENLNAGAPEVIIEDLWDLLQYHVTTFFDNTLTNIPPARHRSGQPLKTITERIKGKEGRIRHNLAGKRVNYSARTVISPDPFLKINEIGVPFEIARVVTVNELVTSTNIDEMKKLVLAEGYPSANYVIRPDGKRKRISAELKQEIIDELAPGYSVERHLRDGDIVLFNRHPSLHKLSLMAHYVKVLPYKTFRLHPAVTSPYNADFDGDEMNIHSPQTEEARAEAKVLLDVNNNFVSVKNNLPVVGCISDAVTGGYLLGMDSMPREEAMQMLYESGKTAGFAKKNVDGMEVFSEIFPKITFAVKTKSCLGQDCQYYSNCKKEKCPYNAYLSIDKGKLLSGIIDKYVFGVEDGLIIKEIDKYAGREGSVDTLTGAFRLGTGYLAKRGFSIAFDDLNVNENVKKQTDEIINDAEASTAKVIESYYDKSLEVIPGKSREESREIKILKLLNEVRTKIGKIVKKEFPRENPINSMIISGAGGNILNVTMIACCVGQQVLWGGRMSLGYRNRTLSFFKENDLSPVARGFIYSSYIKGLKPHEFFFGAVTGRDALMDTALRTPKSGYLYRRLANALQDFKCEYDGTVRDASGAIVQFVYGKDGIDVENLHLNKKVSPGEAVGILTAQSFGEPSTQMTLNVFHFAGVQEMQVTTGLPRLIEIFDARKNPSTPSMDIYLNKDYNNEKDSRIIAEKIKEVRLGEVISEVKVNFSDNRIEISLDNDALKQAHVNAEKVAAKISEKTSLKVKAKGSGIVVQGKENSFKELYKMKEKMKDFIISGVSGIKQVLVVKRERNFVILTFGTNLENILKMKEVDETRTTTNHLHEIQEVLGIEAARQAITNEIHKVIDSQGFDIDETHLGLVADAMTASGELKGVTRMGIISEKSSILARASFETPIKQFVNATIKASRDELASVIENIILNQPVPVGTGLPGLLVKVTGPLAKPTKKGKEVKVE